MISRSFFFNDTATTEIYTLSLHDALPISLFVGSKTIPKFVDFVSKTNQVDVLVVAILGVAFGLSFIANQLGISVRSEEHTSKLQSRQYLVCRLLLEKKNMSFAVNSTLIDK